MTWASDIKSFLVTGYMNLPLALAGTMLILGLMTANYAILFLLFGFLGAAPLGATLGNILLEFLTSIPILDLIRPFFMTSHSEICDLIVPFPTTSTKASPYFQVFSIWMSMMSFLLSYMLFNAIELLNKTTEYPVAASDADKQSIDNGASARATKAMLCIVMISVVILILFFSRIRTGCETILGSALTILTFGGLGYGWFKMLSNVGQDRLSDIFGIANRLLTPDAVANAPVACLPMNINYTDQKEK